MQRIPVPAAGSLSAALTRSAVDSVFMYVVAGWSHGMDLPAM